MGERDPVALHVGAPGGGGVEEEVDEVVVQQVDLVDVEHAPVRGGEQTGLHRAAAVGEDLLQVQRADQPVLGGPDRELHEPCRTPLDGRVGAERAVRALLARLDVDPEAVTRAHGDLGQQRRERPDDGRLRRPLLPAHQHAADPGVDGREQQGQPQVRVADDGREGEGHGRRP